MKQILILCVLLIYTRGDKEHNQPGIYDSSLSQLLNDRDLWLEIKKRLGNIDLEDECLAEKRRNNTIIKTKDSIDAGALFISAPSVKSPTDCEAECCKQKSCNTAVIKLNGGSDKDIACYLFDCKRPNVCIFTSHPGFVVLDISTAQSSDEHANELNELAVGGGTTSTTVATTLSTTVVSTATTVRSVKNQKISYETAGLFSPCHQTSDCKDQNTDCLSGYCICQQGYHVKAMQCRKDCNQELEFECTNNNSPLFSECIAVYDYCDGTVQCSDGSDENSCLESSRRKGGSEADNRGDGEKRGPNRNSSLVTAPPSKPVVTVSSSLPNSPAKTEKPPEHAAPSQTAKPTAVAGVMSPTPRDSSPVEEKQETLPQNTDDDDDFIKQDKVERYFWRMEKNRGAIVVLVLGIILTTVLLILAGCRLRHLRKRYRKGRHLNSNEADYLINGMYL